MPKARHSSLMLLVFALAGGSAAAQNLTWLDEFGSTAIDGANAVAPDGVGGVFVSGHAHDNLSGGPCFGCGGEDPWLARYDSAGHRIWLRQFGTGLDDHASIATFGGTSGVFVGGWTAGSLGAANAGGDDAWLARYDAAGNSIWVRQLGTASADRLQGSASDGAGGVFVVGRTAGALGGPQAGGDDAWLARYDGAGTLLWTRQLGSSAFDLAMSAASDGLGGVVVGGQTEGNLGGANAGATDAWLARYDATGNQLWIRQLGTTGDDFHRDAAADGAGGVFLTGWTQGSLGGTSAGGIDAWLAHYDVSGNQVWIRQLGTSAQDRATAADTDGAGGFYVGGWTEGGLGGVYAPFDWNGWIARYDAAGNQVWIRQLACPWYSTWLGGCAYGGVDAVYVCGMTSGGLSGPSAGLYDAWIARYEVGGPTPTVYCTAKPNSLGCVPSIAMSTSPSASIGGACVLTASHLVDGKSGCFFHGTVGPLALPFHAGYLCVAPPTKRHSLTSASGPGGTCLGVLAQDFNAYIASGADPALVAGARVWIQHWSRDPAAPFGDGLSDAITATISP